MPIRYDEILPGELIPMLLEIKPNANIKKVKEGILRGLEWVSKCRGVPEVETMIMLALAIFADRRGRVSLTDDQLVSLTRVSTALLIHHGFFENPFNNPDFIPPYDPEKDLQWSNSEAHKRGVVKPLRQSVRRHPFSV